MSGSAQNSRSTLYGTILGVNSFLQGVASKIENPGFLQERVGPTKTKKERERERPVSRQKVQFIGKSRFFVSLRFRGWMTF